MGMLDGKVAIVSGVGPGMGRDIALALAREGADVVLGARTEAKVAEVAAEVEALGRKATGVRLDITDVEQCRAAVDEAVAAHGRIDILVNNAFHDGDFTRFEHADLANWRTTMEVNLFGALQLTQAAVPALKESGDGRVVMVNSMSSVRVRPRFGAYTISKAALAAATKSLAVELGRYGIRVNGVHPGYIAGESVDLYFRHLAASKGITFEEQHAEVAGETALGYLPHSSEIAGTVVFLASDLSKPITGQAIGVNAGHWFQGF
jgi:NAD(P)-dependent dehydrogenase (short-subunit alcohol dehydrogenase family)